jgi:hypothetical protein
MVRGRRRRSHRADLHAARLRCSLLTGAQTRPVNTSVLDSALHAITLRAKGGVLHLHKLLSVGALRGCSITTRCLRRRLAGGARPGRVRRPAVSLVARCGSLWRGPLILGFHSRSWGLARASKARSAATSPCDGPSAPGSRAVPRRQDDAPRRLWPRRRNALYPHST